MFTELFQLLSDGQQLTLVVRKMSNTLTVAVLPQSENVTDPAKAHIIPLSLSGMPAELDMKFIEQISKPVSHALGILSNMEQFNKALDKTKGESKACKDKDTKTKAEAANPPQPDLFKTDSKPVEAEPTPVIEPKEEPVDMFKKLMEGTETVKASEIVEPEPIKETVPNGIDADQWAKFQQFQMFQQQLQTT